MKPIEDEVVEVAEQASSQAQEYVALYQMMNVCRASRKFYRHAAPCTSGFRLKSTFNTMGELYSTIVSDLETYLRKKSRIADLKIFKPDRFVNSNRVAYLKLRTELVESETCDLLKIEAAETNTLKELRRLVQSIDTKKIRHGIAYKLASIQMNCDVIKIIRKSIKVR